jgi:hypothetical protein
MFNVTSLHFLIHSLHKTLFRIEDSLDFRGEYLQIIFKALTFLLKPTLMWYNVHTIKVNSY